MATFKLNSFSGIRPRLPESLLPPDAATIAQHCDFGYGELRNTKAGFKVNAVAMQNAPKSVYTDDGLNFFTWDSPNVSGVRSPIVKDIHNKLYYTGDGFRVANRNLSDGNGGPPSSSYLVGVPRPTVAPSTEFVLPVVSANTMDFIFSMHYELAGVKYQEGTISVTPHIVSGQITSWTFTANSIALKFQTYESLASFPYRGSTNVLYRDNSSMISFYWRRYVSVTPSSYPDLASFPATGNSTTYYLSSDTGKTYSWNGDGYTEVIIKKYTSYANLPHNPSYQYMYAVQASVGAAISYYVNYYEEAQTTAESSTPADAFAVLHVKAVSKVDNSVVFDIYTSNSSFANKNDMYTLALTTDTVPQGTAQSYTAMLDVGIRETDKETRAYIYTYVNLIDEEGPPSDPVLISATPTGHVNVTVTKDTIGDYIPIKEIRIYRTPTGSTVAEYFYVDSVPVVSQAGPTFTFLDDVTSANLNEPISSYNNYPPEQDLQGIMSLPNGILAAWRANELHFSEPFKPWAWPPAYVQTFPYSIVGGCAIGAGALITTLANPYIVSGVSSDSMTAQKINIEQAGVSRWSIAVVKGALIYASNDGLVVVNGVVGSLDQSEMLFTREIWRSRYGANLSKMRFSVWDGRLIVFAADNSFTPFMIRFDEASGTMTDLPDFQATCAFVSVLTDQCYFAYGTDLFQFNAGSDQTAVWQSSEFVLSEPNNFGVAQAVVTGSWSIQFYANDVLKHTELVTTGTTTFRLPSGFKSDRWKLKIQGSGRFRELRVANGARELSKV